MGVIVGIVHPHPVEAEDEVHLLQVPRLPEVAAGVARVLGLRRRAGGQTVEGRQSHVDEPVVLQPPGGGQDDARRAVMAVDVVDQRRARQGADDLRRAQDGAPQRLPRIGGGLEMVEDDVVGGVGGLADFLKHHRALPDQFLAVEDRVLEHVGDEVERQRRVVVQDLGIIGRLLARRVGVELAADILDLLGDAEGGAPLGALEQHVLDEMRHAVDARGLVARADPDPAAERDRLHAGHRVGGDAQPVRQRGHADAHAASLAARARATTNS